MKLSIVISEHGSSNDSDDTNSEGLQGRFGLFGHVYVYSYYHYTPKQLKSQASYGAKNKGRNRGDKLPAEEDKEDD